MKMRSVYVGAALILSSFLNASAQSSGQLRAGVNLANVSVTDDGHVDDAKMLPSFQVGLLGVLYKKLRGAKLLYHVQDMQIEAARDLQMIKSEAVINTLFITNKSLKAY